MELGPDEQAKLAQLKRVKRLATGVLIACFVLFVAARASSAAFPQWAPTLGFIAAFAEAATIGGLADWYAVVVLFKHPAGLKIPHTAIIPANQQRIADNLGQFLERNFLSQGVVREKLQQMDFAAHIVTWLGDREKSQELSNFVVRLVPDILAAIEESGFKTFGAKHIGKQLLKTDIAPVATKLIDSFVKDGRYQILLDEIIDALDDVMHDEATLKSIQKRVAEELPTLLYVFQADSLIIKRIVSASGGLLKDVKEDPNHPLREEFQELFENYVERMKSSRRFGRRVERLKADLLGNPEIASLADGVWSDLGAYIAKDAQRQNPALAQQLTGMLVGLARQLEKDEKLRTTINEGMVSALDSLVADQKSNVSAFVSDQVRSWDFRHLVTIIEANVGRDLQYIRFNGMIIGGIAGLILHALDISILL
ncbi:DUF445 domain-containing protein [Pseudahrensia aquimaris]|uniref:DUF445 domain-containing protein n=1 Tax=Pseudahrensia aquimaris TaxID=744461 RepID=A0ABW3FF52_9HYPH